DRIGHEAEVDPQVFDLSARPCRQLRRKARQAEKAGIEVIPHAPGEAPLETFAKIDAEWRCGKGGRESGFSMGRFDLTYLKRFTIFEARRDNAPAAFLSVWVSGDGKEWSIDLMRASADAPMGATQLMIVTAIAAAKEAGADRFNLCMAPLSGLEDAEKPGERLLAEIYERADNWHGLKGLRRFKESFDPVWRPRYLARPHGISAAIAPLAVRGLVAASSSTPVRPSAR
ncbi:MAG: DUF2156 domain-containing protein, partial [Pseudomonadota bacterium]